MVKVQDKTEVLLDHSQETCVKLIAKHLFCNSNDRSPTLTFLSIYTRQSGPVVYVRCKVGMHKAASLSGTLIKGNPAR